MMAMDNAVRAAENQYENLKFVVSEHKGKDPKRMIDLSNDSGKEEDKDEIQTLNPVNLEQINENETIPEPHNLLNQQLRMKRQWFRMKRQWFGMKH